MCKPLFSSIGRRKTIKTLLLLLAIGETLPPLQPLAQLIAASSKVLPSLCRHSWGQQLGHFKEKWAELMWCCLPHSQALVY